MHFLLAVALFAFLGLQSGEPEKPVAFPLPPPTEIGAEKFSSLLNTFLMQGGYEGWKQDLKPRTTGPFIVHPSGEMENRGIHGSAAVKVYYSPQVWDWMQKNRVGVIADGGMIVKVLYARDVKDPTKFSEDPTNFSIMVKDSKGSWDGWFYSDGGPLQKPTHDHAAKFFDPNAGFAISCINCHASADNPEGTYSSTRNLTRDPIEHITTVSAEGLKKGARNEQEDIHGSVHTRPEVKKEITRQNARHWDFTGRISGPTDFPPLPFWTHDHVTQGPRPDGHRTFLTSSNCMSCHEAVQLYSQMPNMVVTEKKKDGAASLINLSTHSEWRHSTMGLSGRDPVFFAQLESERAMHPELADQIDNKCLSCHAVMGQRQWQHDKGVDLPFTHKMAMAEPGSEHAKYGALARDGVSCVVCHQMQPEGMGDPETYSGKFKFPAKPTGVFGPYEKVATLPMENALGLKPQQGKHLSDSKLCASCHVVIVPVLDVGKKYSVDEFKKLADANKLPHAVHEQTTYLEWKNSSYSTEIPGQERTQKSCQECHMPRTYKNEKLKFKVANIEDDTFPIVDHRAADEQLRMEVRDTYSRHSLHGINVFTTEMFRQNAWPLGVSLKNNLFPSAKAKPGFDVAIDSQLEMAREQTARLELLNVRREAGRLKAQVQVTNLTGHKFPSGVNFRRAFIEFKVQAGDKTLWASGLTDDWGVIGTEQNGMIWPLKSEFFKDREFQAHHEKIERQEQVQIYEQLNTDSNGDFTTSFLSLKNVAKDNRLLPAGWKDTGPDAALTKPEGTGKDPDYSNGLGRDVVTYDIPLEFPAGQIVTVSAALYYQALPPYYLKQRFEHMDKPATYRLYQMVNQMDRANTAIKEWKLEIYKIMQKVE